MLVIIHQYQLSTFFLAISHIPVYAVAEANASADRYGARRKFVFEVRQGKKNSNIENTEEQQMSNPFFN